MASPPRILIHVRKFGVFWFLADQILALADRGAEITIIGGGERTPSFHPASQRLMKDTVQGVTVRLETGSLHRPSRLERDLLVALRSLADYLFYGHPDFADAGWLKDRHRVDTQPGVARWGRRISLFGWPLARIVGLSVRWLDRSMPPSASWGRILDEVQPDLVLAAPVLFPGGSAHSQIELLRTASRRGIATAIAIPSWDNLTTKGRLGYVPDRVFVWNEQQKRELDRLHGIEPWRAVVAGASAFDHWFEVPPEPIADICDRSGLDPSQPFALYLGSSASMAPEEPGYFRAWLQLLRTAPDARVRALQVLIRPHPTAASLSAWFDASGWIKREPSVHTWPQLETFTGGADALFRDALRRCAVAVGLNTTGMIDAAIHGAPVCTWESAQFQPRMLATLHYRYLRDPRWGLTYATPDPAEHLANLAALIASPRDGAHDERSRAFVARFIRPRGIECRVAESVAEDLLGLARQATDAPRPGWLARQVGKLIARSSLLLGLPLQEHRVRLLASRVVAAPMATAYRTADRTSCIRHRASKRWHRVYSRLRT